MVGWNGGPSQGQVGTHQNLIFGLAIDKHDSAYKLDIDPCYGLGGNVNVDNISILLTPGELEDEAQTKNPHT